VAREGWWMRKSSEPGALARRSALETVFANWAWARWRVVREGKRDRRRERRGKTIYVRSRGRRKSTGGSKEKREAKGRTEEAKSSDGSSGESSKSSRSAVTEGNVGRA
jgi:hypothetical protein